MDDIHNDSWGGCDAEGRVALRGRAVERQRRAEASVMRGPTAILFPDILFPAGGNTDHHWAGPGQRVNLVQLPGGTENTERQSSLTGGLILGLVWTQETITSGMPRALCI